MDLWRVDTIHSIFSAIFKLDITVLKIFCLDAPGVHVLRLGKEAIGHNIKYFECPGKWTYSVSLRLLSPCSSLVLWDSGSSDSCETSSRNSSVIFSRGISSVSGPLTHGRQLRYM